MTYILLKAPLNSNQPTYFDCCIEPHIGQVTYWRQKPEVSPDEDLRS